MNIFEAVKTNVTAKQAAESYGIKVGRNGMAICPFHPDHHPSMKVDRRFHCFGCQADGDVIDFTARLCGLSNYEAAKKLAEDFSVDYDTGRRNEKRHRERSGAKPGHSGHSPPEIQTDRIHVANGTYFPEGRFTEEKEYCMNRLPVAYNPQAPAPERWVSFLDGLLYSGDIPTLQEYIGYCLIPSTKAQKMLMLKGRRREIQPGADEISGAGQGGRGNL